MDREGQQKQPSLNGVGAPKAKAVKSRQVAVPARDWGAGQARSEPDTSTWSQWQRPPEPIPTGFSESVVIPSPRINTDDIITQEHPDTLGTETRDRRNNQKICCKAAPAGGFCPPLLFLRCLPGFARSGSLLSKRSHTTGGKRKEVRIDPPSELIPFLPPQTPKHKVDLEGRQRHIYINRRPGATVFLQEVSKWFELVIFTASVSKAGIHKYADLVVDKLDPLKLCSWRLFREYCTYFNGTFVKDLSLLGRELRNIIILDNSTRAYFWHTENAIPIKSWFNDPHDRELLDLIPILQSLALVDDIRPVIRDIPGSMLAERVCVDDGLPPFGFRIIALSREQSPSRPFNCMISNLNGREPAIPGVDFAAGHSGQDLEKERCATPESKHNICQQMGCNPNNVFVAEKALVKFQQAIVASCPLGIADALCRVGAGGRKRREVSARRGH